MGTPVNTDLLHILELLLRRGRRIPIVVKSEWDGAYCDSLLLTPPLHLRNQS